MSQVFGGIAIGGPLDGKRVDHYANVYSVAVQRDPPLLRKPPPGDAATTEPVSMSRFDYVSYRLPSNVRVWVPREVMQGHEFEHYTYSHPLDFVLSRLLRSYRPEGY